MCAAARRLTKTRRRCDNWGPHPTDSLQGAAVSEPTSPPVDAIGRVAFIGLGVMGYPMAGHLAKAGLDVTVYNRTYAKAEQWVAEHGGRAARTPREAAQ